MATKKPTKPPAKPNPAVVPEAPRPKGHHWITRVEVESGFLDGLELDFSPHLNCVIGERGTGKTTVLEFLRFALKHEADAKRGRLLKGNLGSGLVRVLIETKEGLALKVEREGGGEARVLDMKDNPVEFTLEHGVLFDCDVYGQDEIETIAADPRLQRELIDRFARADVQSIQAELRRVTHELRGNAQEILAIEERSAALEEGSAGLDELKQKLAALAANVGAGAEALNEEVKQKGLRDRERRALEQAQSFLAARAKGLAQERSNLGGGSPVPDETLSGPNAELMRSVAGTIEAARAAIDSALSVALGSIAQATTELVALGKKLDLAHGTQDARYREVAAKDEAEKGRTTERVEYQRRMNQALDQERALEELGEQLLGLRRRRKELLVELQRLRRKRFDRRSQVTTWLTKELGPRITVDLTQAGDTEAYESLLSQALTGFQQKVLPLARAIAEHVPARDLVRMVQNEQHEALKSHTDLSLKKAEQVCQHLASRGELLYEIEVVETEDVPEIMLLDEQKPKELSTLSTGQKCTTVLPILLLEEEKPLLIDQPEDNVDNRYISEVVVETLLSVKQRRQLIFVTHNANIPVLGDCENVVVMRSNGERAFKLAAGTVDEVKDHVEEVLEGGHEAFEARAQRYGRRAPPA